MREAAMADDDGFPFPLDYEQQLPAMDPLSPETQCQFILKRNGKMTNRIPIGKTTSNKVKQGVICETANGKGLSQRVTLASWLVCFLLTSLFFYFLFCIHFLHVRQSFSKISGSLRSSTLWQRQRHKLCIFHEQTQTVAS